MILSHRVCFWNLSQLPGVLWYERSKESWIVAYGSFGVYSSSSKPVMPQPFEALSHVPSLSAIATCNVEPRFQKGKTVSNFRTSRRYYTTSLSHLPPSSNLTNLYPANRSLPLFVSDLGLHPSAEEQASPYLLHRCQQRPPQAPMQLRTAVQKAETTTKEIRTGNIQSSRRRR